MDTPNISHITSEDYEHVYEPAEDSFLLLDALEKDMKNIKTQSPLFCVEIGVGSGVLVTSIAQLLKSSAHCIGVDISPFACRVAQTTAKINKVTVDVVNMNLFSGFKDKSIDLMIFNPPYVPSRVEKTEGGLESHSMNVASSSIVGTWAGGVDGREVINQVLNDLDRILAHGGVFYLLLLKENKPNDVIEQLIQRGGYTAEVLLERRIIGEHLFVIKIVRR